jgi:hypothetical protein
MNVFSTVIRLCLVCTAVAIGLISLSYLAEPLLSSWLGLDAAGMVVLRDACSAAAIATLILAALLNQHKR